MSNPWNDFGPGAGSLASAIWNTQNHSPSLPSFETVPIGNFFGVLAAGMSHSEIIAYDPELDEEDIRACLG